MHTFISQYSCSGRIIAPVDLEETQQRLSIRMNKSTYLVCVKGICLGSQLVTILSAVQKWYDKCLWYGSDIELIPLNPDFKAFVELQIHRVGTTQDLMRLASAVEQFLSGVFVAFPDDLNAKDIELATEDERFREISNAVVEIRAFDTSYFEVYSKDRQLIFYLADLFSSKVIAQSPH